MLSNQLYDEQKVKDVAMLAGRILLESGAETYRVEDTMTRIAEFYGLHNTHSFVTPTAIIFSLNEKVQHVYIASQTVRPTSKRFQKLTKSHEQSHQVKFLWKRRRWRWIY